MNWKPRGIQAFKARSYVGIEREAAQLRHLLFPKLTAIEALPGEMAFESIADQTVHCEGKKVQLDFHVGDLPEGVEAWTQYETPTKKIVVTLSSETYAALRRNEPRARFSLFHEFGHAWLHVAELIKLSRIPHEKAALLRGKTGDYTPCWDTEWQADAFSAAMLMPAKGLVELEAKIFWHHRVCRTFQVSQLAAEFRISNFKARRTELLSVA